MNSFQLKTLAVACGLTFAGAAPAQTVVSGSSSGITTAAGGGGTSAIYLKRTETRFGGFTGSPENTESLAQGLRTGSEVTLTGAGGETAVFTPPTKPMGYGNVTRAMDLAQRDLAAAGITDPTPTEIQIALMGGSFSRTAGGVTTQYSSEGVLTLRSQGMGWGQIAHTIGVHPGMGKSATMALPAPTPTSTSTTTAAGSSTVSGGKSGIVTAGGGSASHGNGRALGLSAGANGGATTTAAGAGVSASGVTTGKGNGNAFGRGK